MMRSRRREFFLTYRELSAPEGYATPDTAYPGAARRAAAG